jgi:hypothetical protein
MHVITSYFRKLYIIMNLLKPLLLVLTLCLVCHTANAEGVLMEWSASDVGGMNKESYNAAKQLGSEEIRSKNLEVSTWADAFSLMLGSLQHPGDKQLIDGLVAQLTNSTKSDLKMTNRLIIWERISSGEVQFEGTGYQIEDDLFTVAGRANWMLRYLTKKNFGYIKPNSSDADRAMLQQNWTLWSEGKPVEEYANPYPSQEKGMEEIRSPQAIEALVVALKPSSEKDRLTKNCLKKLYKLDELPADISAPGAMCNPDQYIAVYLSRITGIEDSHDSAWWKNWWNTNKDQLAWNSEKAQFLVRK